QQAVCSLEIQIAGLHHRQQLIHGVDRDGLDTGGEVQLFAGDAAERPLEHAGGTCVPVMDRIAEQSTAIVEQTEVNAPGINTKTGELTVCERSSRTAHNIAEEAEKVPVQRSAQPNGHIWETVHLVHLEAPAIELAYQRATTFGPEVERQESERVR